MAANIDDGTADAVRKWKCHRYREGEIPFAEAVASLSTEKPLIEARQSLTRKSDWVICRAGTSNPAVFVFAGVFAEADPYDTGNLVWGKASLPPGMDESHVIRYAGFKASYSFAIETYHEKEIWELQETLDTYVKTVPGFNSRGVQRRLWQNGSTWHWRYYLRTPMFLLCEARGGKPEPPKGLHDWVIAAHKKSTSYRANPVRPMVCGLHDGILESIQKCTPNRLEYGDVVSLVFGMTYVEDREDWGPVPMLTHVIRVQHANRDVYQLTSQLAQVAVDDGMAALPLGTVVDEHAARAAHPGLDITVPFVRADAAAAITPSHPDVRVETSAGTAAAIVGTGGAVVGQKRRRTGDGESESEMEVDDTPGAGPSGTQHDDRDGRPAEGGDSPVSSASTLTDTSNVDEGDLQVQKRKKKRKN